MTTRVQWRQGDVLFERITTVPADAVSRPGAVLFTGERSGHTHAIVPPSSADVLEWQGVLYLRASKAFTVVHDEHHAIALEPGTYRVWQQREYDQSGTRGGDWSSVRD